MNRIRNLWDRLTKPHPRITDPDLQRRARLLASLMLGMAVLSAMLVGVAYAARRGQLSGAQYSYPVVAALILAYALSRTRWAQIGAWLATLGLGATTVATMPFIQDADLASRAMMFLAVSVVFASLLLSARGALIVSLMAVAAGLALPYSLPWLPFQTAVMPLVVISLIALMATAAAFLQERYVETIRRQAEEIGQQSSTLEGEVDRRTHNIMAVAEVGRTITGARNLDSLLRQVVQLIIERFDFYHAQVFLVDKAGEQAILRESSGPVGKRLLAQGHKLAVGSRSVIGQVTSLGEPVIALDTDTSPIHRRNELLPNTRSEMALPLRVGGEVIGALDVQSIHPNAFTAEDVPVFQTMADQLAVAIENTRLFEQAQGNLEAIQRLNQQLTGDAWRAYMAGRVQTAPLGYRAGEMGLEPLRDGVEKGEPQPDMISLPLTVRGESIGAIDIRPKEDREELDQDVQAMLEAVAERVAVALDSTRLAEQAQRTAWREQIVNQISAKLQRSQDLQAILHTALTELGRAMGMSRGFARLAPPGGQPFVRDEDL
jgi:GAF domain-containing protein